MNKEKIAELLKTDPNVDASTVVIEEDQVIFYTNGGEQDATQQPLFHTQGLIELEGGFVHMNDCEGFYNEGVVWKKQPPSLRELNDLVSSVSKQCEKCGCTLVNSVCPNDI